MKPADIAVIGGGIAGAASCVALAQRGVRPVWVASPPAKDRPRIGETLSPAANTILANLGLAELITRPIHRPANTSFSAWGSGQLRERNAIVHLEGPGMVLDRAGFEADLFATALKTRARHIETTVQNARLEGNKWHLAFANGDEGVFRFVLDCTGRASSLAVIQGTRKRADQLVAAHCFLKQTDPDVAPTPATLIETVEDGWWYAALLPGGDMVISYFSDPDLLPNGISRDHGVWAGRVAQTAHISRWIDSAGFSLGDQLPILASAGTTWMTPVSGPNWAAVGDAAAAFDPLSSHGMTTALWMARQASEALCQAHAGYSEALDAYNAAVQKGVREFLLQRQKIYRQETRFADSIFWQRRQHSEPATGKPTDSD
ncbi:glycine oxidase maturase GoxB [Thalassospira profundimaris]|uniref:glycine oxidase maturase GoxB n=1 Tax=Thalassospira profundimaris TaxID=502049 RepID=UPI000DEDAD0D|nr:glycine oxidase maturase GoxB [Thalassospira profundimaris]